MEIRSQAQMEEYIEKVIKGKECTEENPEIFAEKHNFYDPVMRGREIRNICINCNLTIVLEGF